MSQNIALLCSRLNKGKAPKDVSNALNDLRDLMAFHQRVSVAMGTSLQHLADSLFVHMSRIGNLLPHLNRRLNSNISLGDSSAGVFSGDVDGAPTLVSPSRSHTSHINDNYCVVPTPSLVRTVQLDSRVSNQGYGKVSKT